MVSNCIQVFWSAFKNRSQEIALEIDDEEYSYQFLADKSRQIRSVVEKYSDSKIVAFLSSKEVLTYSAIIGIMSSGKAYCPIGHKLPTKRKLKVLLESSADTFIIPHKLLLKSQNLLKEMNKLNSNFTIVTDAKISENTSNSFPNLNFKSIHDVVVEVEKEIKIEWVAEDTIAYLLFTSGTTGEPKGVPITHKSLNTYLSNVEKRCDFGQGLRYSQTFPLTFDLSVHDIFVCWRHNGCLIPIPDEKMISPADFIKSKKIEIWFSVPSQISLLSKFGLLNQGNFPHIKLSLFCGEALPLDLAKRWMVASPQSKVFNLYGPTEATIAISSYQLPENPDHIDSFGGVVSIGKVFEDHKFKILNGELIVTGKQIAGNYWKRSEDPNPFSINKGHKSYKTGDIVDLQNGLLFYLSRKDNQVKINGNRIELEEISLVVRKLIPESEVQTVALHKNSGDSLHVFVVSKHNFNAGDLLKKVKNELPSFMIPKSIRKIDELPLNQSGKVDTDILKKRLLDEV